MRADPGFHLWLSSLGIAIDVGTAFGMRPHHDPVGVAAVVLVAGAL